jgi:hypothetical protein
MSMVFWDVMQCSFMDGGDVSEEPAVYILTWKSVGRFF